MSVAMVIPEMGFDDEPMMPTMRELTVTKKNPNTTMKTPSTSLLPIDVPGTNGSTAMITINTNEPMATTLMGRSFSVRRVPPLPAPTRSDTRLSLNDEMMVGSDLISVM